MSDHRLTRASACHGSCLPIDGCYVHPFFQTRLVLAFCANQVLYVIVWP